MGDVVHVDPAGGDVGRHQHLDPPPLQVFERALALALGAVAVERRHRVPAALELAREPVGAVLGAREDDRAADLGAQQHLVEQVGLEMARDGIDGLRDAGRRPRRRRQVDALRIDQGLARDAVELGRHRGGEHQGLAALGQQPQDAAQIGRTPP